jgi:hypothetical protein
MKYPKPTQDQIEDFARRAIIGLPDSLAARKSDLLVLGNILPDWSHGRAASRMILSALQQADRAQAEFFFTKGGAS